MAARGDTPYCQLRSFLRQVDRTADQVENQRVAVAQLLLLPAWLPLSLSLYLYALLDDHYEN